MSNQFTRVSLAVELEGKVFFAVIPQDDRVSLLMHLVRCLSDDGNLHLVPAPAEFKFVPVAEIEKGAE